MPTNHWVRLQGRIDDVRERWTPDGSFSVVASLIVPRPHIGPARATMLNEQPMPLRANNEAAKFLAQHNGQEVELEGTLRRRYYSRHGEQRWGQVEIWVDQYRLVNKDSQER